MRAGHFITAAERPLNQVGNLLNRGALILCMALAAADFIVVMLEVISRSAGATFIWTEELSRWLLVWMTFIGASVVLKEGGHIRVVFFISLCPRRIGKLINLIGELSVLFFLLFFTVIAWKVAIDALKVEGDIVLLPMFYPKLSMVIGGGVMLIHEAHAIIVNFCPDKASSQNT